MELMEKLLELLNEYTKQSYDDYSFFKYMEPTHSFYVVVLYVVIDLASDMELSEWISSWLKSWIRRLPHPKY